MGTLAGSDRNTRRWFTVTPVVGVGGSAGSIPALQELLAHLPHDLPACVLVTIHTSSQARSSLPAILSRAGALPARHARDGDRLTAGEILVAPPGRHLQTDGSVVRLDGGPRVNRHRPSSDVMFTSLARCCGAQAIAVVLSGVLDDGAYGAALIGQAGGEVLVQNPDEAQFASMPTAALAATPRAHAITTSKLGAAVGAALESWSARRIEADRTVTAAARYRETAEGIMTMADSGDPGFLSREETRLTRLVCPECGGGLAEVDLGLTRFYRCHVGHQYAPQSLAAAQAETAERKLWAALAALDEYAAVARRLAEDGEVDDSAKYGQAAERAVQAAESIRTQVRIGEIGVETDDSG